MAINTSQTYEVTIRKHPLDDFSIQCVVTQEGENISGVANAEEIGDAFDLAHADYVEQLSEASRKRYLDILHS